MSEHPWLPTDTFEIRMEKRAQAAEARADALAARLNELTNALNYRDLFINPELLEQAADEIDCGGLCEYVAYDYSVNVRECSKAVNGEYCPNDVAETLRDLAKVAHAHSESKP